MIFGLFGHTSNQYYTILSLFCQDLHR